MLNTNKEKRKEEKEGLTESIATRRNKVSQGSHKKQKEGTCTSKHQFKNMIQKSKQETKSLRLKYSK